MAKYIKKPLIIEAIQVDYLNNGITAVENFLGFEPKLKEFGKGVEKDIFVVIETLEGEMKVSNNDFIIKGINGEFYPCKPDIFEKIYELV